MQTGHLLTGVAPPHAPVRHHPRGVDGDSRRYVRGIRRDDSEIDHQWATVRRLALARHEIARGIGGHSKTVRVDHSEKWFDQQRACIARRTADAHGVVSGPLG